MQRIGILVTALVLMAGFIMPGCSGVNMDQGERLAASELSKQYLQVHEQYKALDGKLPPAGQRKLEELARPLDQTRELLIKYNNLVIDGQDSDATQARVRQRIIDLAQQIASIALEYSYESE